jgi:ABC-type dipeptide/oligopeptide/nickel transport system permease component
MEQSLKRQLGLIHGTLMIFVWLIAVPIGIGCNMYCRKKNKTWGVKLHMAIMAIAAFLPFTISAILVFIAAGGKVNPKPHSVSF